ncbi:hypothetical protein [Lachnoclostridium sp.]|uniref:hypothetical protein n=1 Tax=Lachnoclostridium sp. TaxID=2028282 RepID=UPI0028A19551|nr:hypothetical protein [Lachnoclostridium sp.]
MFRNKNVNRKVYYNNVIGLLQISIGGFCSFIFGLGLIGCIMTMFGQEKTAGIVATSIIFILFILFVTMLKKGLKRRRLTRIYYTCAQQHRQNPAFNVDQLALVLRRPLGSVKKDLDTIVKMGFTDTVNINNKSYNQHSQNYRTEKPRLEPNTIPNTKPINKPKLDEYVEVNCKNCGASNRILKGSAVNCEYCGSMMKWK